MADEILTVGHSTHELPELVALLRRHGVELVADVRRFPGSRRMPRFDSDALERSLATEGIRYEHLEALGGRRVPRGDERNSGWRDGGFRGYADHMATDDFASGLARLEALGRKQRGAVMCAEAQWTRCHRRLLSDALLARGWRVLHIGSRGGVEEHELTPFARVRSGQLSYPAEQTSLDV
jgi:uncharacterized protein (DUF488 family)